MRSITSKIHEEHNYNNGVNLEGPSTSKLTTKPGSVPDYTYMDYDYRRMPLQLSVPDDYDKENILPVFHDTQNVFATFSLSESSNENSVQIDDIDAADEGAFYINEQLCTPKSPQEYLVKPPNDSHISEISFIDEKQYEEVMAHQLYFESDKNPKTVASVLTGNRIVDLGYVLNWATKLQYNHSKICTLGELEAI